MKANETSPLSSTPKLSSNTCQEDLHKCQNSSLRRRTPSFFFDENMRSHPLHQQLNTKKINQNKEQKISEHSPINLLKNAENILNSSHQILSAQVESYILIAKGYFTCSDINETKRMLWSAKTAVVQDTLNAFYKIEPLINIANTEIECGWHQDALNTNSIAKKILLDSLKNDSSNQFHNIMRNKVELLAEFQCQLGLFPDAQEMLDALKSTINRKYHNNTIITNELSNPELIGELKNLINVLIKTTDLPSDNLGHDLRTIVKWRAINGDIPGAVKTANKMSNFLKADAISTISIIQANYDDIQGALTNANSLDKGYKDRALLGIIKSLAKRGDFKHIDSLLAIIEDNYYKKEALFEIVNSDAHNGNIDRAKIYLCDLEDDEFKTDAQIEILRAYIKQERFNEAELFTQDFKDKSALSRALLILMDGYAQHGNVRKVDSIGKNHTNLFEKETSMSTISKEETILALMKANAIANNIETTEKLCTDLKGHMKQGNALLNVVRSLLDLEKLRQAQILISKMQSEYHADLATIELAKSMIENKNIVDAMDIVNLIRDISGKTKVLCLAAIELSRLQK